MGIVNIRKSHFWGAQEIIMAKGQKRGNRETRKPKTKKEPPVATGGEPVDEGGADAGQPSQEEELRRAWQPAPPRPR